MYFRRCNWKLWAAVLALTLGAQSEPMPVRHVQGYLHGFLALKDAGGNVLGWGELKQNPAGGRVTSTLTFHFKDGSQYQETSVFSQSKLFRLLSYKQIEKGPAFKRQETLTFDATGNVHIVSTDEHGKQKEITKHVDLPDDLANGILPMLLTNADAKAAETTMSMLVSTPEPRIVKLKIAPVGQDAFAIAGSGLKATHYEVKIDIGGVTGVAAKVVGKQPAPTQIWISGGGAPVFLKSEGPLFADGPMWRIQLASPAWPKGPSTQER